MIRAFVTTCIGTLLFCSCGQKQESMEYLLSWRNRGEIDTVYADIIERKSNDLTETLKYRFDSKQKGRPADEFEFILPKKLDSIGTNSISLVYETTIEFEGKDYKILKYQFDDLGGSDEESLYFYTPEFGIILFHWGTHRNSQRLIRTGDVTKDKVIYYLTDRIENDYTLTKSW